MFLIGILEFICLIAFPVGVIWFLLNLFKKKSKKKPSLIMILSFIGLIILVVASDIFYHDELEQSRIERESREADEAIKKIKELEEKNKQLEEENKKLEEEKGKLENDKEKLSSEIQSSESDLKEDPKKIVDDTEQKEKTVPTNSNDSENSSQINVEDNEKLDEEDGVLSKLKEILGEKVGSEAYDLLVNQIGFTNLRYIEKSNGTGNYIMSADECDFILTAFSEDKVYRVFQPNGGAVFYEDDALKMTAEELRNNSIDHNNMSAYYIVAKEIVENGLKNPRSAKFPSIVTRPEEIAMSKNGDIIAVQSYVDAENSFGAMIRSKWTVQFEVIDISTYSYNPLYVNVDGETLYGEWSDME